MSTLSIFDKCLRTLHETSQMTSSEAIDSLRAEVGLDESYLREMKDFSKAEGVSISDSENSPFGPEPRDLLSLWRVVQACKPLTILEFGSGHSTKVLARAALSLRASNPTFPFNSLRSTAKPFHVWSVDESRKWSKVARKRLSPREAEAVTLSATGVDLSVHGASLATRYKKLPDVKPDFIYIDGPSQFACRGVLRGISMRAPWRMPTSADLLSLEWLLEPGTVVLVDGRVHNCQFLFRNLQREWKIERVEELDQTLMTLTAATLGKQNRQKIEWQAGSEPGYR